MGNKKGADCAMKCLCVLAALFFVMGFMFSEWTEWCIMEAGCNNPLDFKTTSAAMFSVSAVFLFIVVWIKVGMDGKMRRFRR